MTDPGVPRRERILEAALGVFVRLGYRKTTMEDVARAADLSRQGVYLQFPSKQELLAAAVEHELARALDAVRAALAGPGDLSERLTIALDEWLGKGTGESADDVATLGRENAGELSTTFGEARQRFIGTMAAAIDGERRVGPAEAFKAGQTLHAAATGWKYLATDRADFRARIGDAARLVVRGAAAEFDG